ncbi:nuclear transcription factor Y subunit C-3 [Elaeis guineensis]|uniref:Nuclear transcription factor Y subunit C-3 n=1 Tax=Elaeis guineensis var. tenera TaxID=51953 RepID=A0A6I9RC51_ELAGV|nr:nuclear transcription factor Y subunit C-3 [Elaeis guineensis]
MDNPGQGQPPVTDAVHIPYIDMPYQDNQMMGSNVPISSSQLTTAASQVQLAQHQLFYQRIQKQQLQQLDQTLRMFWASQYQEILATTDFKNHSLPLARIKKIMKADEDVRMIAAEAPVLFARACEMFILELTYRSWAQTEDNKRRTLHKNDIAGAITRTDVFDFLVDVVPREDLKEEVNANDSLAHYYASPQVGSLGMIMNKPGVDQDLLYAQMPQPYVPQQFWEQQQTIQQQQPQHQEQQPGEDLL